MNWWRDRWLEAKDNPNVTLKMWQPRANREEEFKSKFLGDWSMVNDAVYSREEVSRWLASGRIDEKEADRLLRLRYTVNRKGEKVIDHEHDDA